MDLPGLRLAVTTLTVVPMWPGRIDRTVARRAMLLAPLVGLGLGVVAASLLYGVRHLWSSQLVASVLVVVALAVITGGLHLDGLADTADGLAARGRNPLEVMKASDIGAFGAATVALVIAVQVFALADAVNAAIGTIAVLTAVTASRLALTLACVRGVRAARPDGLGATVAGTVPLGAAVVVTLIAAAALCGIAAVHDGSWVHVARVLWSVAASLISALALVWVAVRRFGGVTGDVLGAVVEVSTAVALLAITVRA
jgi:adenosylcobinamide-GDP ribazoletransferase